MIGLFAFEVKLAVIMGANPQEHKHAHQVRPVLHLVLCFIFLGASINRGWVAVWGRKSLVTRVTALSPSNTDGEARASHTSSESTLSLLDHEAWENTGYFCLRGGFKSQIRTCMWMYFVNSIINILAQNEVPRYLEEGRQKGGSPVHPM